MPCKWNQIPTTVSGLQCNTWVNETCTLTETYRRSPKDENILIESGSDDKFHLGNFALDWSVVVSALHLESILYVLIESVRSEVPL